MDRSTKALDSEQVLLMEERQSEEAPTQLVWVTPQQEHSRFMCRGSTLSRYIGTAGVTSEKGQGEPRDTGKELQSKSRAKAGSKGK